MRPPGLLTQTAATGPHGASGSSSLKSKAISGRSSAYTAVSGVVVAHITLLDAKLETRHPVAQLKKARQNVIAITKQ